MCAVSFHSNQPPIPIPIQHTTGLIFGELIKQMMHLLPCQVIEKISMSEVVDIIKVHQGVDDVVLQPSLLQTDFRRQSKLLVGT